MRWNHKTEPNLQKVKALSKALDVERPLASLLVQRGIETYDAAKDFFRPSLEKLYDPFLMKDMDKAVTRIERGPRAGAKHSGLRRLRRRWNHLRRLGFFIPFDFLRTSYRPTFLTATKRAMAFLFRALILRRITTLL
jgi:hypothetical protein